jgi:hypothetical protein
VKVLVAGAAVAAVAAGVAAAAAVVVVVLLAAEALSGPMTMAPMTPPLSIEAEMTPPAMNLFVAFILHFSLLLLVGCCFSGIVCVMRSGVSGLFLQVFHLSWTSC